MDSVELGRQIAAELHHNAVKCDADPSQPLKFVLAEIRKRDYDAEAVLPGANVLDKGRACLIPKDFLILYEKSGSEFERAFLIAHELGHIVLGDAYDGESAQNIDPTRPSESSPVGIERVVGYGSRQRREIQMDLFAREFLLPRELIRALHVEEEMSASQIAGRFGAPFEVVAQQLFDALLLPRQIMKADEPKIEHSLNCLQRKAASHRNTAFLLEAGPGTGKTQTLVARVEGLLDEGVDPRRILLLTFSNKAAAEMAERISHKRKDAASAMWIGTFHAFGLDIVRRFYTELGLPEDPRMLDRTEAVELLEDEFPNLPLIHYRDIYDPTQNISDILSAISRAKDEVVNAEQYAELSTAMLAGAVSQEDKIAAEKTCEVALVYAAYEKLKSKANCIDFGDLVSLPVQLLEKNIGAREHLQRQFDHVLVDEYQDVNRSSIRLLKALCATGKNLWAVGDAKQSIYRFRGASSFNLSRFGREDFPGGERGRLKRNYRSVSEIVDAYSSFSTKMSTGDLNSELEAERGASGKAPMLYSVDQVDAQVAALAENIEVMRSAGFGYCEQAVLCTGNEKLSTLARDLEHLNVPVLFLGNLFERPEVKDLLSLLSLLIDRRAMGLVRLAGRPEFQININDVAAILDHLRVSETNNLEWFTDIDQIADLSDAGKSGVATVINLFKGFKEDSSPWDVLATILLDRTRIAATLAVSDKVTDRSRCIAIWQLLNFVRVQPPGAGLPISRLLDRIRRLVRLNDDRDLRSLPSAAKSIDAVRLMTMHGAKGLEFAVVHAPNMNAGTLPRAVPSIACAAPDGMVEGCQESYGSLFATGHNAEQECLFYVALSRAKDRLFLYAVNQKANGHAFAHSSFLERLSPHLHKEHVRPTQLLPKNPDKANVPFLAKGNLSFTSAQIALYERCPRRFFYTHILQVGGRRKSTAFMMMHDAVRSVFQAIIRDASRSTEHNELNQQVLLAFEECGLAEHGYVGQFRNLALAMLQYFLSIRAKHEFVIPTGLVFRVGSEEITIRPDDVLIRPNGTHVLRRIQTGHSRSSEAENVAAAAFVLAAKEAFPGAEIEIIYLSDQTVQPISLTAKKLQTRQDKLGGFLANIRLGRFPADRSDRVCPRCPAFFICGPLPDGQLVRIFNT
ncbi:UvrD-helicase domain-containing protein [Nitrosospira sp. NRS527]|uniref:UvrD-helicase domain-containing protein n=1 Tax=Nitrosospira sp. NRS527 TaxID=155925 RepID=UPI001AF5B56E|nr:UvrD-helicase domain-containing protein [Nitrosospira sp. NRS527]BCT69159.1 ATP-dependent DNA helicase Rep [Nitrosospira sp. NRS527]